MDTKTRKQEALSLLEKIDPTDRDYLGQDKFCFRLNLWTAERAGYTIKDALGGWEVAEPEDDRFEFVSFLTDAIPSYTHSVDACLTLPVQGWVWELHIPGMVIIREADNYYDTAVTVVNKPVPLAMLKAWWSIQS